MSRPFFLPSEAGRSTPRTGILVECQPKARRRLAAPAVLVAPHAPQSACQGGFGAHWARACLLPVTVFSLGMVFLFALTLGGLYLCHGAPPAPSVGESSSEPVVEGGAIDPLPIVAKLDVSKQALPTVEPTAKTDVVVKEEPAKVTPVSSAPEAAPAKIEPAKSDVVPAVTTVPAIVKVEAPPANNEPAKAMCPAPSGDFFGTAVTFAASPKIAGEEAAKQHKLLFVLHVSGNFEDPGFT